jgi:hypothetical protein
MRGLSKSLQGLAEVVAVGQAEAAAATAAAAKEVLRQLQQAQAIGQ